MRFFRSTAPILNQLRSMVMEAYSMPNGHADQPWAEGATTIALGPHHYEPADYAAMVETALEMGVVEITEEEYRAAQPISPIEP